MTVRERLDEQFDVIGRNAHEERTWVRETHPENTTGRTAALTGIGIEEELQCIKVCLLEIACREDGRND